LVTKVRKAAGAAVLPLLAAAVAIGVGATPADAAICSPLSSASITAPSGTITAGSTVHASARVFGMLFGAHMQITGPGLDRQVGSSVAVAGTIRGDVKVPEPGKYSLAVLGNGTGCVYDSTAFTVKQSPSAPSATPHASASGRPAGASRAPKASRIPGQLPAGGNPRLRVPDSGSPYRLPPVAPDGSGPSLRLPSADPQVAAPPIPQARPRATDTAQTLPPIKWGQSIAIALVLLLLSAHMGMWSRRQRLAQADARRGPAVDPATPRTSRRSAPKPPERRTPSAPSAAYPHEQRTDHGSFGHRADTAETRTTSPAGPVDSLGRTGGDMRFDQRAQGGTARQAVLPEASRTAIVDWETWVGTRREMGVVDQMTSLDTRGRVATVERTDRLGAEHQLDAIDWATVTMSPVVRPVGQSYPGTDRRPSRTSRGYRGRRRRS
jgi:hypothetical protein